MAIRTIYLETTIFNFPFVDYAPQYRADTLRLFDAIEAGKFKAYTSDFVIHELNDTKDTVKRDKMTALIDKYGIVILSEEDEENIKTVEKLAAEYVLAGIIPAKYSTDALHIAVAAVNELDCIVSLNFEHIIKRKTILETEIVNIRNGYKRVSILSPSEVFYAGNS